MSRSTAETAYAAREVDEDFATPRGSKKQDRSRTEGRRGDTASSQRRRRSGSGGASLREKDSRGSDRGGSSRGRRSVSRDGHRKKDRSNERSRSGSRGANRGRSDPLARAGSTSAIQFADDLFDSSSGEDSDEGYGGYQKQSGGKSTGGSSRGGGGSRKGGGSNRNSNRHDQGGSRKWDESDEFADRGMVRVDAGVKPINQSVATMADSILDFFS